MTKWLKKTFVTLVTVLTFGMFSPFQAVQANDEPVVKTAKNMLLNQSSHSLYKKKSSIFRIMKQIKNNRRNSNFYKRQLKLVNNNRGKNLAIALDLSLRMNLKQLYCQK